LLPTLQLGVKLGSSLNFTEFKKLDLNYVKVQRTWLKLKHVL